MANAKLTLPINQGAASSASEGNPFSDRDRGELLKTQRATIEGTTKVAVGKLQVAQEAISAVRALFEIFKSHNELKATRAEWEGRVTVAENAVKKAKVDLEIAEVQGKQRREELDQSREALKRLLGLFDDVMKEAISVDLSEETKKEARRYLLQLSDYIVRLRN